MENGYISRHEHHPFGEIKDYTVSLMLHSLFTVPKEKVYIKVKLIVQLCYSRW